MAKVINLFQDPVVFYKKVWPNSRIYDKQREIMYSVRDNAETLVPAGHKLGKDYIAARIAIWCFCSRRPCRIVVTGPSSSQIEDVFWGELLEAIEEMVIPFPLEILHNKIYQLDNYGNRIPKSELVARVVGQSESMLGKHAERGPNNEPTTLLIADEASGCDDESWKMAETWAHRRLGIGNPYQCRNFFFQGVKAGDMESVVPEANLEIMQRKIVQIKDIDSPNVQIALAQIKRGEEVTHENIIPGVLTYAERLQRLATWDRVKKCVGLDAEFYVGEELLLFPPVWLNHAEELHDSIPANQKRKAKGIGIDPAEGGDSTCYASVDELGLIELLAVKTPDTSEVMGQALAFMRRHGLDPNREVDCDKVVFDRGGGGKQHADYMRRRGYAGIRTAAFGGAPTAVEKEPGKITTEEKRADEEARYTYKNKRAELSGRLSIRLDPDDTDTQFAISREQTKLREQLAVIPLKYDPDGRLELPPKRRRNKEDENKTLKGEKTLVELIGYSPDEMDAVGLAVYAMEVRTPIVIIGSN